MVQKTDELRIHYWRDNLRVYTNPAGDVFVEDLRSGATLQVETVPGGHGGLHLRTDCQIEATRLGHLVRPARGIENTLLGYPGENSP